MRKSAFAILTILAATATPSRGGVIQNWFAGTVTSVSRSGSAPDLFAIGDPVWGLLTYSTTPNITSGSSTSAEYKYDPLGIYGLSITTGGVTFTTTEPGEPYLVVDIENNFLVAPDTLRDAVYVDGWRKHDLPGLFYGGQIYETIQIVGGPSLVTSAGVTIPFSIDLSRATSATGYIQSTDLTNGYKIDFNITEFGQIPEPGTLSLLLAGAAALAAARIHNR